MATIKLFQTLQDYIYVPADFDTKIKSPLRRKWAEKGLKYKDYRLGDDFENRLVMTSRIRMYS